MNDNTPQTPPSADEKPLMTEAEPVTSPQKPRRAWFALRAVGATVLLALLLGVVYLAGYRAYPTVAVWSEPGDHSAFVYEEQTYFLAGQLGKRGLTKNNYKIDKLIGKVHDDGLPTVAPETETEAPTEPEDTEEINETDETEEIGDTEEIESVTRAPQNADPTLARDHAYVLYSVKDKEGYLLLLAEDGELYVYYREDVGNPVKKS